MGGWGGGADGGASGGGTGGAVENEIGALKQSKHPKISLILIQVKQCQCTDSAFFDLADCRYLAH